MSNGPHDIARLLQQRPADLNGEPPATVRRALMGSLQAISVQVFTQLAEVHFASQGDSAAPLTLKQMTKADVAASACDYAEALIAEFVARVKREQEGLPKDVTGNGVIITG